MAPLEERIKHEDIPSRIQPMLDRFVKIGVSGLTKSTEKTEVYFTRKDDCYYAHVLYDQGKKEFIIGLK